MDAAMRDPNSDTDLTSFSPDEGDRPVPGRPRRRPAKVALATAGIALGLAGVAGASWGALTFLSSAVKPRGEIVVGRVDYPDIKDGVPALAPARTAVRVIPGASAPGPSAGTLQPGVDAPREPIATGALAALLTEPAVAPGTLMSARPVSRTLPAASTTKAAAKPEQAKPDTKPEATKPEIAAPARTQAASAAAAPAQTASVPLPPSAPARAAKPAAPEPRPMTVATAATTSASAPVSVLPPQRSAARQQAASAPAGVSSAAAKPSASAPQPVNEGGRAAVAEDDSVNVFGLAVPSIGAAGRRLREGAEAFGDAVASLPGRL
jgi:hypothetical protein